MHIFEFDQRFRTGFKLNKALALVRFHGGRIFKMAAEEQHEHPHDLEKFPPPNEISLNAHVRCNFLLPFARTESEMTRFCEGGTGRREEAFSRPPARELGVLYCLL